MRLINWIIFDWIVYRFIDVSIWFNVILLILVNLLDSDWL